MLLSRWYQFGNPDIVLSLSGGEVRVPRARIFEALRQKYTFRGATQALGRGERVNELLAFFKSVGGVLAPEEQREIARRVIEQIGVADPGSIISPENTKIFQDMWEMQMAAQSGGQQGAAPEEEMPPATEIPLEQAREAMGG
jgi:hypothetical protein